MVKSYSILVVDDSRSLRMVIRKLLESTDYLFSNIYEAGNGKEALDLLKDNEVNMVLTDINMPEMDGINLVKVMKMREYDIPTIVVSTDASQETVITAIKFGAKGYIKKPFSADKIKDVLDKFLK
ncbi:MAG: hypothetical protein DKM50_11955 [Candidatus Margulisiibacteriota bacterium]|nr:MAG: hypothetical protein A2X43_04625 [Candidatus Margulisbacteria bacterium GWD2_39_127]OGI01571.1 MAG: hypothetical protein A2X42_08325 [Candidatus Margulisbacteria bacterium GWF2_38_17]OGI10013.1 MAG: hypothetical protein A2X41_09035 [Candidatus Margulisbacteria bacterium GWE2_39_32]PZM78268.1 MAG: hypothetical protein DKM50_11955 [Candidatus Margulisiibacteriota bacterium]HAR61844.1 hypothetical protein [Candidatus Margulisiibacteriota bacterium]